MSSWYPLHTDNGGPFKAIVTSDSQSSDYTDWKNLIHQAAKANQDAAFMIALGDLVDNGEDEYQWQTWFESSGDLLSRIPVAPALGNHEAYSLDWKNHMPQRYLTHFNLPDNGNKDLKNHYYSFDWGDVHFTVLDTSLYEEKSGCRICMKKKRYGWKRTFGKQSRNGKWCSCTKILCSTALPMKIVPTGKRAFRKKDRPSCLSLTSMAWIW